MDEIDYILHECRRQHVTNYGDFALALHFARQTKILTSSEFKTFVQKIAFLCEPKNKYLSAWDSGASNLRTSHVGFMLGGSAAPVSEVHYRFDRWGENVFSMLSHDNLTTGEIDQCVFQLLQIHPWVDGNGRTSSILRNWMLGTLNNPDPLPNYRF